jgi:hypothetical protein
VGLPIAIIVVVLVVVLLLWCLCWSSTTERVAAPSPESLFAFRALEFDPLIENKNSQANVTQLSSGDRTVGAIPLESVHAVEHGGVVDVTPLHSSARDKPSNEQALCASWSVNERLDDNSHDLEFAAWTMNILQRQQSLSITPHRSQIPWTIPVQWGLRVPTGGGGMFGASHFFIYPILAYGASAVKVQYQSPSPKTQLTPHNVDVVYREGAFPRIVSWEDRVPGVTWRAVPARVFHPNPQSMSHETAIIQCECPDEKDAASSTFCAKWTNVRSPGAVNLEDKHDGEVATLMLLYSPYRLPSSEWLYSGPNADTFTQSYWVEEFRVRGRTWTQRTACMGLFLGEATLRTSSTPVPQWITLGVPGLSLLDDDDSLTLAAGTVTRNVLGSGAWATSWSVSLSMKSSDDGDDSSSIRFSAHVRNDTTLFSDDDVAATGIVPSAQLFDVGRFPATRPLRAGIGLDECGYVSTENNDWVLGTLKHSSASIILRGDAGSPNMTVQIDEGVEIHTPHGSLDTPTRRRKRDRSVCLTVSL